MNKWMLAAGMVAASALAMSAFAACPPGSGCEKSGLQRMAEDLHLSQAQLAQIEKIRSDARQARAGLNDALRANREAVAQLDPAAEDYMEKADGLAAEKGAAVKAMMKVNASEYAAITAALTPSQRARRAELHKQRQKRRSM